jgi:hypothetical protein
VRQPSPAPARPVSTGGRVRLMAAYPELAPLVSQVKMHAVDHVSVEGNRVVARFGIIVTLAATGLSACAPTNPKPSSTGAQPIPTQPVVISQTPVPSPTWSLQPESLSWSGETNGTLTQAYATCHLTPTGDIALRSADSSVEFALPGHTPGTVAQSFANLGVSLHVQPGVGIHLYTLFLGASGSASYATDGVSGSVDAWLAAQSNVPTSPSVHISGMWKCG